MNFSLCKNLRKGTVWSQNQLIVPRSSSRCSMEHVCDDVSMLSSVLIRKSNMPLHRTLFTNTDAMKRDDPYATLGIQWGATNREVKDAFKKLARELHPDVNTVDEVKIAQAKFQRVKDAYEKIMTGKGEDEDKADEWRFRMWRKGDIISQERTDVAGELRRRPIRPVSLDSSYGLALGIGHPTGTGQNLRQNELLATGDLSADDNGELRRLKSSRTVGTGINKWVSKKEYKAWSSKRKN